MSLDNIEAFAKDFLGIQLKPYQIEWIKQVLDFTGCQDCEHYIKPEYEGDWRCVQSECIFHIGNKNRFVRYEKK